MPEKKNINKTKQSDYLYDNKISNPNRITYRTSENLFKFLIRNGKVLFALLPVFIILILIAGLITQTILIASANIQNDNYIIQRNEINFKIENDMDFVNNEYADEKIRKILTLNDLYVYTNTLWEYNLSVNGIEISDEEIFVSLKDGEVKILLTEIRKKNPLPSSILEIGSITRGDKTDSPVNHFKVNSENAKFSMSEDGNIKYFEYIISDVTDIEEIIEIEISDQLGSKISIPSNIIKIIVE